ncbi:NADP-dependent oxidoreductase [Nocardioides sp. Kera G14]|uniref:NADP-dependent oxidoreductase n=1 Tax=Nocardioides sp. Kera G14 TaxID=2884264 RepID=UPI001D102BF6|nr:NADP-dependent oxidoreductase [Nocardioides sp. Kera G14]UDY22512.1 NADP-dependent oxidoreductase [Nocardioides sp. Kera G14]
MSARTVTVIRAHELGDPEVMKPETDELGDPAPDEVQVETRAIGVNPIDLKQRSGFKYSEPAPLPFTPGQEVAGVVTAVGDLVTEFVAGDEVLAFRVKGGYATALNVPASDVFGKPATLSWEEAGGLLLVGVTAVHALEKVGVGDGDRVLVHGASGSVGQLLIQLANARGATVVGTASPRNHDLLSQLGATPIPYGDGLLERASEVGPFDAAIDLAGTAEAFDVSLALVADKDRITTIIGGPHAEEAGVQKIGGGPGSDLGVELRNAARADLVALAGEGRLQVPIVKTFPLTEAVEAHRFVGEGHAAGKVILLP